jgi:hypothetical protein
MRKTIALALIALIAALAFFWYAAQRGAADRALAPATAATAPRSTSTSPASAPSGAAGAPPALPAGDPADPAPPSLPTAGGAQAYPVDLDALRARLPDNLYWSTGAPTDDEKILKARADRARLTNQLFGKVQSNTASDEEIEGYYAERRRMSEDYIQFAELVLAEYGAQLPEEHIGLYELSIRLHRVRLGEIPRDMNEALARRRARKRP